MTPYNASGGYGTGEVLAVQSDGWVVKNTFLELDDPSPKVNQMIKRSASGGNLSNYSSTPPPSVQELREWSHSSKASSRGGSSFEGSDHLSGCSTPRTGDAEEMQIEVQEGDGEVPENGTLLAEAEELYNSLLALGGTRSASAEVLVAQDSPTLRKHVPLDANGQMTSIGSVIHFKPEIGTHCRPCIFWSKGRCGKAHCCLYCHYRHANVERKRLRASKATRERRAKLLNKALNDADDTSGNSVASSSQASGSQASGGSGNKGNKSRTVISL